MIFIRSFIFNTLFYSIVAINCCISSIIGPFSRKAVIKQWNHSTIPFYKILLKYICGIEIEIRGAEYIKQENVIFAGKHESALETYILSSYITKAVFILKKELTYIPIFGWAQALYGMIAVNRGSGGAAMKKLLKDVKSRMENGRPLIIFPEGTRRKPGLKETVYKPGLYFIAQNMDVPVIPFALNTGLFWEKSSFLRHKGKVIIEFLPPMPANLDKHAFMEELKNRIETKCNELNEEAASKYPSAKKILDRNKEAI